MAKQLSLPDILKTITKQTNKKFKPADAAGLAKLKSYKLPPTLLDFYKNHEPEETIYGQVVILNIQSMIEENEKLVPGAYIHKHGYIVMGTNNGDAYCYNLNTQDSHPPIVLISHEMASPDITPEEVVGIAKPVAENLLDFLDQFTRNEIEEDAY